MLSRNFYKIMFISIFPVFLFGSLTGYAQDDNPPPCSYPEASQLDFWVGEVGANLERHRGKG